MKKLASAGVIVLGLAACSNNVAATVNGDDITLDEVRQVTADIADGTGTQVSVQALLPIMILAESALPAVRAEGISPSEQSVATVEQELGLTDGDYSEETKKVVDFYAINYDARSSLDMAEEYRVLNESIVNAEVSVNERFGTWNGEMGQIEPTLRDYLAQVPASE